jgi:phthalate 4,5-cis-dihydrodiol dehydrogenase
MDKAVSTSVLRFGVIGLGRATLSFLPALLRHPGAQITAGADPRPEARAAWARDFEAETYETAEQLCASPNVDAVYVATPHQLHAPNVLAAAAAGKHVICEKPMALTLEDCDAMIAATERTGVKLVIGHSQSYSPPIFAIRDLVRGGEFGRLGMMTYLTYKGLLYTPRRPEELDPALGGGVVFNQAPHQVDSVRWIGGGLVRSVRAQLGVWDSKRPVEGAYSAFLEFEDGATAQLVFSAYGRFDSGEFHFWIGESGQQRERQRWGNSREELERLSREEEAELKASLAYGGERQPHLQLDDEGERHQSMFGALLVSCERADLRPSPKGVLIYAAAGRRDLQLPSPPAVKSHGVDELDDAVVHGAPVRHDGRWGKATLEVLLALHQSSSERREIVLQHQVPTPDRM